MVIAASLDDGIPGAKGIAPEDNAGIVSVGSAHTQVEGHEFLHAIEFQGIIDLFQPFYCHHALGIRRDVLRLRQDIDPAYQFIQGRKRFLGTSLYLNAVQELFHAKIIPVIDQFPYAQFRLLIQAGILYQALEKVYIAYA
ncbi:hypothetical protein SDC9_184321 [bioreactor metagenome]|uniref:Uncharacterized protein n=1 Tax=bioreactor metagenome TaxID=1076179 RepID=A0A645HDK8_9ZZZZ